MSASHAVIRTRFFGEDLLRCTRRARCRQVVPLAARLDTRVPAGVAAVVRPSGTGLPVAPARGRRHSKMTASCPSSLVAAGRSSPAGGTGCPALTRARPPPGRPATDPGGGPLAANADFHAAN